MLVLCSRKVSTALAASGARNFRNFFFVRQWKSIKVPCESFTRATCFFSPSQSDARLTYDAPRFDREISSQRGAGNYGESAINSSLTANLQLPSAINFNFPSWLENFLSSSVAPCGWFCDHCVLVKHSQFACCSWIRRFIRNFHHESNIRCGQLSD